VSKRFRNRAGDQTGGRALIKEAAQRGLARRNLPDFLGIWKAEPALCG